MNFYGEMTSNPITGQSSGWKAKNSTFADQRRAIKSHVNTSVFNLTSLENYIKNRWSINANAPIMTEQQFRDIYTRDTLYVRALDEDKIYKVSVNVPSNWSISKRTDSYNGAS